MMPSLLNSLTTPESDSLADVCQRLADLASPLQSAGDWPEEQLATCARGGVFRWFVPREFGGLNWSDVDLTAAYVNLAAACLTTTFIITQRSAAVRRIVGCANESLRRQLIPDLATGQSFATVGISQLSTSRRHLGRPSLRAAFNGDSIRLDGYSAWVTGAAHADTLVLGAETDDGLQMMLAVPGSSPGIEFEPPAKLIALSSSQTAGVTCNGVMVSRDQLLTGPAPQLMLGASGGSTGGLPTSALALGLASAAIDYVTGQSEERDHLQRPAAALTDEWQARFGQLLALAAGSEVVPTHELRSAANSLVLRATQAALVAAKGAGFVASHPVGRWCREALFFLVWSCPQSVVDSNLCEFMSRVE
jgi:alkylation response protein AidB-like acyl-CoA dehydrogenase